MECVDIIEAAERIERAKLLIDNRRWKEAEAELHRAIASEDARGTALYWLAWTLLWQDRLKEAETAAARAIAEDPEWSSGYYIRAVVLKRMGIWNEAEEAIRAAIHKNANVPEYRALLAHMRLDQRRPQEALEIADQGLRNSPEAVDLHQVRTDALIELGKLDEAGESARQAASLNPQDEFTMAQLGRIAFNQKDFATAQERFGTALRILPTYTYARRCLLETLRARTWIYRLLAPKQKVKMTPRMYIGVLYLGLLAFVGALIVPWPYRILPALGCALAAFVLVRGYVGLAFNPLSALALRLNPSGRAALSREEIRCSNYVALLLGGALLATALTAAGIWIAFLAALLQVLLVIPVAKIFQSTGRKRTIAVLYTVGLALSGVAGIVGVALHQHTVAQYSLSAFIFLWLRSGSLK